MKLIHFSGENAIFGEGQPQYGNLPAFVVKEDSDLPIIFCYKLEPEEIELLKQNDGRLWFQQLTFARGFHPVQCSVHPMIENRDEHGNLIDLVYGNTEKLNYIKKTNGLLPWQIDVQEGGAPFPLDWLIEHEYKFPESPAPEEPRLSVSQCAAYMIKYIRDFIQVEMKPL